MLKKKNSILRTVLIMLIINFVPLIVLAKDYGTGSIAMQLEFNNKAEDKFTVDNITVNNEFPWTSAEDAYLVDERTLVVVLEVTPKGDYVPRISYCGEDCGKAYKVVQEQSGSKFTITVTITDPEQDFVTFDLVEDEQPSEEPGNPEEPRTCLISYVMNGGEEIPDGSFICGNPAPPPASDQIKNGDKIFVGWYENEELNNEYHFDVAEDRHVYVYAKWDDKEPEPSEECEEPTYHVVLDFNGAKDKDGKTRVETESVGVVPFIVSGLFIDELGVIPPEGQTLVAIKINGKIYEIDKGLGYELNKDTTFLYIWSGSEVNNNVEITTSTGVTVSFEGEEGEEYGLKAVDILSLDKEDLENMGITEEEYNEVKNQIIEQVKGYGAILSVYTLEVDHRGTQYKDSVKIRVKMTDEMKKYNSFKFIYIDENNNFKVGDIVDVQIDGEYLVGTLPHLSVYAVVGENIEETKANNPNTSDSVIMNIVMLVLCLIGLTSTIIYIKRHKLIRL